MVRVFTTLTHSSIKSFVQLKIAKNPYPMIFFQTMERKSLITCLLVRPRSLENLLDIRLEFESSIDWRQRKTSIAILIKLSKVSTDILLPRRSASFSHYSLRFCRRLPLVCNVTIISYLNHGTLHTPLWQTEWNPTQSFFSLTQWNFSLHRTWRIFKFYPASLCATFTYVPSIYHLCTGNTATWQKEATWRKICRPGEVFWKNPVTI